MYELNSPFFTILHHSSRQVHIAFIGDARVMLGSWNRRDSRMIFCTKVPLGFSHGKPMGNPWDPIAIPGKSHGKIHGKFWWLNFPSGRRMWGRMGWWEHMGTPWNEDEGMSLWFLMVVVELLVIQKLWGCHGFSFRKLSGFSFVERVLVDFFGRAATQPPTKNKWNYFGLTVGYVCWLCCIRMHI